MRYFVHIAYMGNRYCGWQRHPGVLSVQEVLEAAISKVLKINTPVVGCGRTDAGVHASQFFFHMDVEKEWGFDLGFRLNKLLPDDIAIFDIIPMEGLPHARFDCMQRTYDYFIHTYKDPFLSSVSAFYPDRNLHLCNMKAAVALLPLYNDYRAFCKSPDRNEHTICHISSAALLMDANGDRLRFHISANRFLGKMIRTIAGRLLDIGRGTMSVDQFEHYLAVKDAPSVITPAYPQGLHLSKVTYPYLDLPQRTKFSAILQNNYNKDWLLI